MRKIRWACGEAVAIYQGAAVAITEAGVTKGLKTKEGIRSRVEIIDGANRVHGAVDYTVFYSPRRDAVIVYVSLRGCSAELIFDWPGLKLTEARQTQCVCNEVVSA